MYDDGFRTYGVIELNKHLHPNKDFSDFFSTALEERCTICTYMKKEI